MQPLQANTFLQGGKYKIVKVLGQGGFGITYLANHEMLDQYVCIKEFFFREYCDRETNSSHITIGTQSNHEIVSRFQHKFIKEAKTIFKLRHPNIIPIHDIFTENDTAYYVMDYIEGKSLLQIVKKQGPLSEATAISYIKKVGSALTYIHSRGINHLDIKPGNIMIRQNDDEVFIIDFGVAKQYDATTSEGTTTTPVGISHGYSPAEQYRQNGVQAFSPQSDVYALAATLFKLLTGNTPPEAIEVQEDGIPEEELIDKNISSQTIAAIKAAMKSRKQRTQTVREFIDALCNPNNNTKAKELQSSPSKDKEEATVLLTDTFQPELPDKTFTVGGVSFAMKPVAGGTFTMGGTLEQAYSNELPAHQVTLSDYYIGETAVTQELWQAVMRNSPSDLKDTNFPVENVSWKLCQEFIHRLNAQTGQKFRLPTEAEWEYAARGGRNSKGYIYSGSNNIDDVAWYDNNSGSYTHGVKSKHPNELGIYDMSGNVWEWCHDWYGIYNSNAQTNPTGPNKGSCRVLRGGSRYSGARFCRVSNREGYASDRTGYSLGLRLAL